LAGSGEAGCWLFAIGDWLTNGDDTHFSLTSVSGSKTEVTAQRRDVRLTPTADVVGAAGHVR
jgi:hypothetical protein